jgi:hypothetical protein
MIHLEMLRSGRMLGVRESQNIMEKTLLVITLTAMCAGAFAQGKISIMNDANHLVAFGYNLGPYGCSLAGTLVTGSTWVAELWGHPGTAPGSLALLTSVPMSASIPGIFGPFNWNSPLPGGSASTFQVRVRDTGPVPYIGYSQIFTMQPGGSIAYNSLVNPGGTTLSTWANGTVPMPGGFAAILVDGLGTPCPYPEPSTLALSGLGLASLLLFHRHK